MKKKAVSFGVGINVRMYVCMCVVFGTGVHYGVVHYGVVHYGHKGYVIVYHASMLVH